MMAKKKAKKKKIGFISRIILILNIFFAIGLLLSYLSLYISPERNWFMPFFGLLYPYFLLINILFSLYWIIRLKLYFIISLLLVLIGWQLIQRTVQFKVGSESSHDEGAFLVMSYNVRNMCNNNMLIPDLKIRDAILDVLADAKPDILCLQEFESFGDNPLQFIDSMARGLGLSYYEFTRYNEEHTRRIDAIITFSRFPILSSTSVKKDDLHNYCLINDLQIGNDTVRLFNIHLESVRLKHEDYTFIKDLDLQFEEEENIQEGSRRIFKKLSSAYSRRASQVRNLDGYLSSSPHPVILCGDFNDTPCSFTYQILAEGKEDAFIESGTGLGNTYAGTLPSLRIDYILYDQVFTSRSYATGREKLSDHYPITSLIGYKPLP
jgi:endonuclease/exonuclease/phosphatase family metal-dependent hydrolase